MKNFYTSPGVTFYLMQQANKLKFNFNKHLFRVLVFPSCNEPGLEIIQSLIKSNKVDVFGGSSGDIIYDPSRQILLNHQKYPSLYDQGFKEKFIKILKKNKINYVFPTVDVLVSEFAGWNVPGVTFITPGKNAADLVLSKKLTYKKFGNVIPVPRVYLNSEKVAYPAYAKPDKGSGAKESFIITNADDLKRARRLNFLVCEHLIGEEYTVDAVNDLSGKLLYAGVRVRGKIGRSISLGTQSVADKTILKYMELISQTIKIKGPWFAQFKRDNSGVAKLMEINCRLGGSSTLTRIAGVNIPLLSLFIYAGYPVKLTRAKKTILVNRALTNYCETPDIKYVIWDLDDTLVRKDGKPDPESLAAVFDFQNRGIYQYLMSRKPNIEQIIDRLHIPHVFREIISTEDKVTLISGLIKKYKIKLSELAIINDSTIENLSLSLAFKQSYIVTPDALAVLGREKVG